MKIKIFASLFLFLSTAAYGQSTEFNYQGNLNVSGTAANGNYEFEFRLFDALAAGGQIGPVLTPTVAVANGTFAVKLDFGAFFPGADRYLEIRVRPVGGTGYTVLDPRQRVGSSPYAIKSLLAETANTAATATNATQLGGTAANQYVLTTDPRMTDARTPITGSASYIQNQNAGAQAASNFNISGTGTANILNAANQYNIGGQRVLAVTSTGITQNFFAGIGAGANNTTGGANTFFGISSGLSNDTGSQNSFFGRASGISNLGGGGNSFFGHSAGQLNSSGSRNTFVGMSSGRFNSTGTNNTAVGFEADIATGALSYATAIGANSVVSTSNTVVLGRAADTVQVPGIINTATQYNIGGGRVLSVAGTDNLFVGAADTVSATNTGSSNSFVGKNAGLYNTTGNSNSFFGRSAGLTNDTGIGNSFFGIYAGRGNTTGDGNTFLGFYAGRFSSTGNNNTAVGFEADIATGNLSYATAIGANSVVSTSNSVVLGRTADTVRVPGNLITTGTTTLNGNLVHASGNLAVFNSPVRLVSISTGGETSLCRRASDSFIATCGSSLRYKTNINQFSGGLDLVDRLKPITFDWKDGGMHDLGLGAEDVAAIEPLLVTYNAKGEVEGVKYDRIGVVLVNAVKEQQVQIDSQKAEIENLKKKVAVIDELTKLLCDTNPSASVCKENK